MSVRMMTLVFERYPNGGGERVLALALADHAHDDGTHIFPSVATLAVKSLQSERTVQYQLRKMEKMGWLLLVAAGGGRNRPAEYRISPAWINGAKIAPFSGDEKGCNPEQKGCNSEYETVQSDALNGAIAVAPEPSVTINNHQEPSECVGAREAGGSDPGGAKQKQESPRELLARYGVPDDTAKSWMRVRKAKRKEITPQALDAIQREAEKLGITLNEALAICCEQSWAGFRATWQEAQEAAAAIRPTAETDAGGAPSAEKPSAGVDWWSSPEGVLKRGSELGIAPHRGESAAEFKRRVQDKHREAQEESARGVSSFLRRRQQGDSRREAA